MKNAITGTPTEAQIHHLQNLGFELVFVGNDLIPMIKPCFDVIKTKPLEYLETPQIISKFYVIPCIKRWEQPPKNKPIKSKYAKTHRYLCRNNL
jgi:hypothetical protein